MRSALTKFRILVLLSVVLIAVFAVGIFTSFHWARLGGKESPQAGSSVTQANPFLSSRRTQVQSLLDKWSSAIRSGDEELLKTLIDPQAPGDFVDREITRLHNRRSVQFSHWDFELSDSEVAEVPISWDAQKTLSATDVWAPQFFLKYAIADGDEQPTVKTLTMIFARRGDNWLILNDTLAGYTSAVDVVSGVQGPWDFGPVVTRRVSIAGGRSAVILGHPETEAEVEALAEEMMTAVPAVVNFWGPQWTTKTVLIAAASDSEFAALTGTQHPAVGIAAVTVSDKIEPGSKQVTGQRIIFSPEAAQRLTALSRVEVLRHELTHLAARAVTVDGSPMWVLEGFADYVGRRGLVTSVREGAPTLAGLASQGRILPEIPSDRDYSVGGENLVLTYELGWTLSQYIAEKYGEVALVKLYRQLCTGPKSMTEVDKALRAVFGGGVEGFSDQWRTWLSVQLR